MRKIRLGTRGSKLALIQAEHVKGALEAVHGDVQVELVVIKTSGDWKPEHGEVALSEAKGGKGQFIKEIEKALLADEVDCGVHSLKDVPAVLPDEFSVSHILKREDPRDVLITRDKAVTSLGDLPQGAVIGTSSRRRAMFALLKRPDCRVEVLRGNVDTRLAKLADGQADATFLALAGLNRMNLTDQIDFSALSADDMVPCGGQGAVALEVRRDDMETASLLDPLHDDETALCCIAERSVLAKIGASCHTPIGVYGALADDKMTLHAVLGRDDGSAVFSVKHEAQVTGEDEAIALGEALAHELMEKTPSEIQSELGVGIVE